MLRSLKSQRTKVQNKIQEQLQEGRTILSADNSTKDTEELKTEIDVNLSVLNKLESRLSEISGKIAQISDDRSEEELDQDSDILIGLTTEIDILTSKLSLLSSKLGEETVSTGLLRETSNGMNSIQNKIDKLVELQSMQTAVQDLSSSFLSETPVSRSSHVTRLPKLEFEKFSGDVLKYQEFWDSFEAAIHSNPSLRQVEKLNYLRAYLAGEAKRVISGVATCDPNYEVAVNLLKKRFGNTQVAIDAHYGHLMSLPQSSNNTEKLRSLMVAVEKHLRCLSALGEDVEHRHFISMIMSKLPREVVVRLEEGKDESESWSVEMLRKKIHCQLSARESAERQQSCIRYPESRSETREEEKAFPSHRMQNNWTRPRISDRYTVEGLVAGERSNTGTSNIVCVCCGQNHFSDQCKKYQSLEERRRCLRGRCFICLSEDHLAQNCRSTKPCFHCKRIKSHNRCLCPTKFPRSRDTTAVITEESTAEDLSASSTPQRESSYQHAVLASGGRVLLQTAAVEVKDLFGSQTANTRALLDCASNRSYVSSSLAQKLQIESKESEILSVVTFGSEKSKTVETKVAQIRLSLKNGSSMEMDINIVPKITGAIYRSPVDFEPSSFLWKDLPLADSFPQDPETSPVDFLIGNDYYLDLVTGEKIQIGNSLYLLGSKLGWLLTGRLENVKADDSDLTMFVGTFVDRSLPQISNLDFLNSCSPMKPSFGDFWELESIGITDNPHVSDDDRALEMFNTTVKTSGGRYEVTWPWKDSNPDLPENYDLALGRFQTLLRKFKANPDLFEKYAAVIKEQEQKGIVEKVTSESPEGSYIHYIPHHAVVTPGKATTKVRIVYDASAKTRKGSNSLNECFLRGPVILEDLCGLLVRFRLNPVAVVADIEKAFLQIGLQILERDVTRFFWLKNPAIPSAENNLQIYRFCRVPFGVRSSPFLLAATLRYHLRLVGSAVSNKIHGNLYVDNAITGVDSEEKAIQFYREAKQIFQGASMNLREWASNSAVFLDRISRCDKVKGTSVKVLGLKWELNDDLLSISTGCPEKLEAASTKRQMLQSLAMIFDPMGFFVPLTLRAKLLIHQLWSQKMDWDNIVEERYQKEWKMIATELLKIPGQRICRFIGSHQGEITSVELFCFCDASALAYSTTVYAKATSDGSCQVHLLFAKSRLSPSRALSIPRLELLAVVIGTRCLNFVEEQLQIPVSAKVLWTDSQCVLHWICSKKPQTVFVENRLREIRMVSSITFRYVSTQQNPADISTRGKFSYEEMNNSIWWHGPPWLSLNEEDWPIWPYDIQPTDLLGNGSPSEARSELELVVNERTNEIAKYEIEMERFSSIIRLYRVTAWISRFIEKIRKRSDRNGGLDSFEISAAKDLWERHIQQKCFSEVFQAIHAEKKCNLKEQLNIKVDDKGILRCYGRFLNSDLEIEARFPKLLPKKGHYTELVIRHFHSKVLHSKVQHTLSQLRQEYWIPQGRSTVKGVISRCVVCRRCDGGPYRIPSFPDLPVSRVCRSSPFSYVGVDYLGPLYVKVQSSGRRKVWICLFTCMAVRAIHLELVQDLSAEQFLLCFRRFIARRGKPIQILSDNASQFKMSKDALDRLWSSIVSDPDVTSYISSQGVLWKFIIERAPWMGGFYERLVGTVKRALKKGIGRLCLTTAQLMTVLIEVEAVVNSRPLFYVSDDDPHAMSVSPADFLSLNPKSGIPFLTSTADDPDFLPTGDSTGNLLEIWKKGHKLLEQFWQIWIEDYLASLRERSRSWHKQGRVVSNQLPKVNDPVLVEDGELARGSWKMGIVQSLIPSFGGQIRAARVRFSSGKVLNRPLKRLYPLEDQTFAEKGHGSGCCQGQGHGGGGGQLLGHSGGGGGQSCSGGGGQGQGHGGGVGPVMGNSGGGGGQGHGDGGGQGQSRDGGGCQVQVYDRGGGGQLQGHGGGGGNVVGHGDGGGQVQGHGGGGGQGQGHDGGGSQGQGNGESGGQGQGHRGGGGHGQGHGGGGGQDQGHGGSDGQGQGHGGGGGQDQGHDGGGSEGQGHGGGGGQLLGHGGGGGQLRGHGGGGGRGQGRGGIGCQIQVYGDGGGGCQIQGYGGGGGKVQGRGGGSQVRGHGGGGSQGQGRGGGGISQGQGHGGGGGQLLGHGGGGGQLRGHGGGGGRGQGRGGRGCKIQVYGDGGGGCQIQGYGGGGGKVQGRGGGSQVRGHGGGGSQGQGRGGGGISQGQGHGGRGGQLLGHGGGGGQLRGHGGGGGRGQGRGGRGCKIQVYGDGGGGGQIQGYGGGGGKVQGRGGGSQVQGHGGGGSHGQGHGGGGCEVQGHRGGGGHGQGHGGGGGQGQGHGGSGGQGQFHGGGGCQVQVCGCYGGGQGQGHGGGVGQVMGSGGGGGGHGQGHGGGGGQGQGHGGSGGQGQDHSGGGGKVMGHGGGGGQDQDHGGIIVKRTMAAVVAVVVAKVNTIFDRKGQRQ